MNARDGDDRVLKGQDGPPVAPDGTDDPLVAEARPNTVGRRFRRYFFTGLVVILPGVISIFVLWRLFAGLDRILGRYVEIYLGYRVPGVGLVALLLIIVGVGAIASNIIGKRLIQAGESLVERIPLVRWVYRTTKQLFSILLREKSTSFRKVVLVKFPCENSWSMAFQTSESAGVIEDALGRRLVTVFLPTTPNPTSGYFLLVPEEDVISLDISVNEGLRYIISAGALAANADEAEG